MNGTHRITNTSKVPVTMHIRGEDISLKPDQSMTIDVINNKKRDIVIHNIAKLTYCHELEITELYPKQEL